MNRIYTKANFKKKNEHKLDKVNTYQQLQLNNASTNKYEAKVKHTRKREREYIWNKNNMNTASH
jgi:hypothetical protein